MVLINYKETNLAKWQLSAWISAAQTTINLNAWEWDLFPSIFPFMIKLEQYDSTSTLENKPVLKRELVQCTNRVWDILTVVRGFEPCPASDTATTQTTTAFAFDANDYVFHIETAGTQKDIKDELVRLETDKLNILDYISWDKLFKDSTTGTDAYQVNIPEITSYAQIDWQALRVRVDVGNTADATLEINALWAKDIVKFKDNILITWDVSAWQIIFVIYNSNNDNFEIKDSVDQSSSVVVEKFMREVVLWEDIQAWDWLWAVFFGRWYLNTQYFEQLSTWTSIKMWDWLQIRIREQISVPSLSDYANAISSKLLNIRRVWSPTDSLSIDIYESDWVTLIQNIWSILWSSLATSYAEIETALSLIDLSGYEWQNVYMELSRTWWQSGTNHYEFWWHWGSTMEYYNWASWIADNTELYKKEQRQFNYTEWRVWKGNSSYRATNICDWIIIETWLALETKKIVEVWYLTQSNVEVWENYYLWGYAQNNILDTSTYTTSSSSYTQVFSYTVLNTGRLEWINMDIRWYTSWMDTEARIMLNWWQIGSTSTSNYSSRDNVSVNLNSALVAWDIISIDLRVVPWPWSWSIRNIDIIKKDVWEPGRFWVDYISTSFIPFIVWQWHANTWIQLMNNGQHAINNSINYLDWLGWSVLANSSWSAITTEETFVMDSKWWLECRILTHWANGWGAYWNLLVEINWVQKFYISSTQNQTKLQERRIFPVNEWDTIYIRWRAYINWSYWRCYYQFYNY